MAPSSGGVVLFHSDSGIPPTSPGWFKTTCLVAVAAHWATSSSGKKWTETEGASHCLFQALLHFGGQALFSRQGGLVIVLGARCDHLRFVVNFAADFLHQRAEMGGCRVFGAVAICKTPLADGLILILIAQTGNDFTVKPVRHRYVYHEIVRAIVLVPSLRFLSEGQIGGGERHDKRDGGSHLCPSRAASLLLRPPLFTFALVHVRFLTERTIHLGNKVLCLSAPWRRANASSFSSLMDSSFGVSRI